MCTFMAAPTSNNFEGFIPDENKGTPIVIRHRVVGPQRPSSPELEDIFRDPRAHAHLELEEALNGESAIPPEIKLRPGTALEKSLHTPKKTEVSMDATASMVKDFLDNKERKPLEVTRRERERGRGQGPQEEEASLSPFEIAKNNIDQALMLSLRFKKEGEKMPLLNLRRDLREVSESKGVSGLAELIKKAAENNAISIVQVDSILKQLAKEKIVEEKASKLEKKEVNKDTGPTSKALYHYLVSAPVHPLSKVAFKKMQWEMDRQPSPEAAQALARTFLENREITQEEFNKISEYLGVSSVDQARARRLSAWQSAFLSAQKESDISTKPAKEFEDTTETDGEDMAEPLEKATTMQLSEADLERLNQNRPHLPQIKNVGLTRVSAEAAEAALERGRYFAGVSPKKVDQVKAPTEEALEKAEVFPPPLPQWYIEQENAKHKVKIVESESLPQEEPHDPRPIEEINIPEENPEVQEGIITQEIPVFGIEQKEATPEDVATVWNSIKSAKYASPFFQRPDGRYSSVPGLDNEQVQSAFEELVSQGKLQPTSSKGMYSVVQNNPVPFEPALMSSEEALEDFKPLTSDEDREQGFKWEIMNKIDKQVHENKLKKEQELHAQAEAYVNANTPTVEESARAGADPVVEQREISMEEAAKIAAESEHAYATEAKEDNQRILTEREEKDLIELERQRKEKAETGEVTPPELMEALEEQKKAAYAERLAETLKYENANRAKKKTFGKLMTDLAAPFRQMPPTDKPEELLVAERKYAEVRRDIKRRKMQLGQIYNKGQMRREAEEDVNRFNQAVIEALPPKERSVARKWHDTWSLLPLAARITASTALFAMAAGGLDYVGKQYNVHIPFAHAITMGGATGRLARSALGVTVAQPMGMAMDIRSKKNAEKRSQKFYEGYTGLVDKDKMLKNELELAEFYAKEENYKKRDIYKKIAAMLGVGIGVGVASGVAYEGLTSHGVTTGLDHVGGSHVAPSHVPEPVKVSAVETTPQIKPSLQPHLEVRSGTPVTTIEAHAEPVSVELSNKGFIDTFAQLKEQVKLKYPDITTAPKDVQEMMKLSPTQLAEKFGLYKPGETFQSAIALKGEHLSFDAKGDLILERHGGDQTLFNASTDKVSVYRGAMLDAKTGDVMNGPIAEATPAVHPSEVVVPTVENPGSGQELLSQNPRESVASMVVSGALSTDIDLSHTEKLNVIPQHFSAQDAISGKAPLVKEYQFGDQFKDVRKAHAIAFEKAMADVPAGEITKRLPIDYMGGRIQVIQKGNELIGLLNGEKIGTGKLINGGIGWQYEDSLGKGGIFAPKSPYEEAFKKMCEIVDKKKAIFTAARV